MAPLRWTDVQQRVFDAYRRRAFADALVVVEDALPHLPEHASKLRYWQACQCTVSDPDGALRTLEQAVATGLWFTPERLTTDPDLDIIRTSERFGHVFAACRERLRVARMAARPQLLVRAPQPRSTPASLLVALHGTGGDATLALENWGTAAERGWVVAAPQSSELIGPDEYGWSDWRRAEHELDNHLAALRQQYSPQRIVMAGFSRGGGVAVTYALLRPSAVDTYVAVAPAWPEAELHHLMEVEQPGPPGLLIIGDRDRRCVAQVAQLQPVDNATIERHPELGHAFPVGWPAQLPELLTRLLEPK